MTDIRSVFDLATEASAFIRDSGDQTVTRVIRVESLRDAEMVLAGVTDSVRDRVLAAWVVNKGGRNVAEVKTAGQGFGPFVDRSGPLVVVVAEKTFRHLACDEALWRRVNLPPPSLPPPPPLPSPVPSPVSVSPSAPPPEPLNMEEFLASAIVITLFVAVVGGYMWWRHRQVVAERAREEAAFQKSVTPISLPVPANPSTATRVDVQVMIDCQGHVEFATPKVTEPLLYMRAGDAARDVNFPAGDCDKPLRSTTITIAVQR